MSYDEEEVSEDFGFRMDDTDDLDDEVLEPIGDTDFGLDEEDPDKDS